MEPNKNSEKSQITSVSSSALLNNVSSMSADSCDDLSDIELKDVPAQLETTLKPRPYEASTLFNIDLDEIWGPNSQEEALQEYKERAQKDQQKFFDFVMESALDLGNRTVNYKPNEEQQRYLDQGPNLQNFVRGSLDFINTATRFQAEHEEIMELQDNIKEQYQFLRNNMVNNAFHQNLAGKG